MYGSKAVQVQTLYHPMGSYCGGKRYTGRDVAPWKLVRYPVVLAGRDKGAMQFPRQHTRCAIVLAGTLGGLAGFQEREDSCGRAASCSSPFLTSPELHQPGSRHYFLFHFTPWIHSFPFPHSFPVPFFYLYSSLPVQHFLLHQPTSLFLCFFQSLLYSSLVLIISPSLTFQFTSAMHFKPCA